MTVPSAMSERRPTTEWWILDSGTARTRTSRDSSQDSRGTTLWTGRGHAAPPYSQASTACWPSLVASHASYHWLASLPTSRSFSPF